MSDTLIDSEQDKAALMDTALECVVDSKGDIMPLVIEEYYQRCPDGKESFEHHGFDGHVRLTESMVDSVLYCITGWVDNRREIESLIADTVPHHKSLKIPRDLLVSLLDVTLEVLLSGVPIENQRARSLLVSIGREIRLEISNA